MYRFLLTPRWLGGILFVIAAVVFCCFMGSWQLSRFEGRVATHRATQGTSSRDAGKAAPVPLAKVLPKLSSQVTTDTAGEVVTATGRYDASHQMLVPGRTLGDSPREGFYVLDLLRVDGGAALPVVRGWLPGGASAAKAPAPPSGEVTVTGYLQAPETPDTDGVNSSGGLPSGQVGMISAATLVNLVPYDVYSAWVSETPATAPLKAVPYAAPAGTGLDLKAFQNLGYTGEWFVFAGFVVFMWFRLVRREAETRRDAALGLLDGTDEGTDGGTDGGGTDGGAEGAAEEETGRTTPAGIG